MTSATNILLCIISDACFIIQKPFVFVNVFYSILKYYFIILPCKIDLSLQSGISFSIHLLFFIIDYDSTYRLFLPVQLQLPSLSYHEYAIFHHDNITSNVPDMSPDHVQLFLHNARHSFHHDPGIPQ